MHLIVFLSRGTDTFETHYNLYTDFLWKVDVVCKKISLPKKCKYLFYFYLNLLFHSHSESIWRGVSVCTQDVGLSSAARNHHVHAGDVSALAAEWTETSAGTHPGPQSVLTQMEQSRQQSRPLR
jgi:hypothetical protein